MHFSPSLWSLLLHPCILYAAEMTESPGFTDVSQLDMYTCKHVLQWASDGGNFCVSLPTDMLSRSLPLSPPATEHQPRFAGQPQPHTIKGKSRGHASRVSQHACGPFRAAFTDIRRCLSSLRSKGARVTHTLTRCPPRYRWPALAPSRLFACLFLLFFLEVGSSE